MCTQPRLLGFFLVLSIFVVPRQALAATEAATANNHAFRQAVLTWVTPLLSLFLPTELEGRCGSDLVAGIDPWGYAEAAEPDDLVAGIDPDG